MRAKKVIVGVAISAMLISSSIPVMAFSVTNGNKMVLCQDLVQVKMRNFSPF